MRKKLFIVSIFLMTGFVGLVMVKNIVLAEQSGSSPESGATSRIKTIYDSLVSLTHGSDSAGGWGNWGVMWNRIRSAAEWVPSGDADEADVASGKTFYKNSRTQKTGTAAPAFDYSTFQKVIWQEAKNGSSADGDNAGEEATWTNTSGGATNGVWKDERAGIYVGALLDSNNTSNIFVAQNCDFFSTSPRGNYIGGDSDCGNAINTCATLASDATGDGNAETDWYLPSYKELLLLSVDGLYNNTNTTFVENGSSVWWSSSESYGSSDNALKVYMTEADVANVAKTSNFYGPSLHCVRRD